LKNENKLENRIKNNYIHDQASVAEIINFDEGKSLKRSKSNAISNTNKTTKALKNNTIKDQGVDSQLVKEV